MLLIVQIVGTKFMIQQVALQTALLQQPLTMQSLHEEMMILLEDLQLNTPAMKQIYSSQLSLLSQFNVVQEVPRMTNMIVQKTQMLNVQLFLVLLIILGLIV